MTTRLARLSTMYEEKEFHWRLSEGSLQVIFEGKVDRIHQEGGTLKIVDYKSGGHAAEAHGLQLGIYRLAMESVLGERGILTSNLYLSTGEEVEHRFCDQELRQIRDEILEAAAKIAIGNFEIDDKGDHRNRDCGGCGYQSFCPHRRDDIPVEIKGGRSREILRMT